MIILATQLEVLQLDAVDKLDFKLPFIFARLRTLFAPLITPLGEKSEQCESQDAF